MSARLAVLTIVLAAFAGIGGLAVWAPDYLTAQGFPLDDAWIHAVYGRELARSGMLAYNPGISATGSTAPLWSLVVAIPHLITAGHAVVLWVKVLGFTFHVLTAVVLFAALRDVRSADDRWALAGAVLVAAHPDLVSASVSGMEIPLASLAASSVLYTTARGHAAAGAAVAAAGFLVRPELAVVSVSLPLLGTAGSPRRGWRTAAAAVAGTAAAVALLAARNWAVSGLPLPATFYAKVGDGPALPAALHMGFAGLLRELPLANSLLLLAAMLGVSVILLRGDAGGAPRLAAAGFISGLAFCAVSFALIAPIDPEAFYHQRYVLPALPLLVVALPLLFAAALARSLPARYATAGALLIVALCLVGLARSAPARFAHLANDARNIDDVQVALGQHLAGASSDDVVWAVDAGAVRYFGNAFVVDMLGLNTPELLGTRAQAFLDAHPPRWIEVVPSWSNLSGGASQMRGSLFEPSSPYTVTGFPMMQRHLLVRCAAGPALARFAVRARVFDVSCSPANGSEPLAGADFAQRP